MKVGSKMAWLNGETVSLILFFIGIYGLIARKNVIKTIISIGIMQTSIIIFFITINYKEGSVAPIGEKVQNISDPLPQALMITAIVIGVVFTSVSLTMFINLYHKYGTKNWSKIAERRMGIEDD
jgi:multicomponent Na+:H+ antiporter subunit C